MTTKLIGDIQALPPLLVVEQNALDELYSLFAFVFFAYSVDRMATKITRVTSARSRPALTFALLSSR